MNQQFIYSVNVTSSVDGDTYVFRRSTSETTTIVNDPFDVLRLEKSQFPKVIHLGTHSLLELDEFIIINPNSHKSKKRT